MKRHEFKGMVNCQYQERGHLTIDTCNQHESGAIHQFPPDHEFVPRVGAECGFEFFYGRCGLDRDDSVHIRVNIPVLPYPSKEGPSSGFFGSSTSEAAARDQDADGRTKDKQVQALRDLAVMQFTPGGVHHFGGQSKGLTWAELDAIEAWGHGSTSRVLSDLHKAGRIARLTEERNRCKVYVLPEYVNGRETEPHGGKKSKALAEAEAAIQRVRDLHAEFEGISLCVECRVPYPCATLRALDG